MRIFGFHIVASLTEFLAVAFFLFLILLVVGRGLILWVRDVIKAVFK